MQAMVARSALVQRIVQHVADGVSVSAVGRHSAGRTELLRQFEDTFQGGGFAVLHVKAIEYASPLEAFHTAIARLSETRRMQTQLGKELSTVLTELLGRGPAVMLVDDIDVFDEQSWVLLEQLHRSCGVPIVATSEIRAVREPNERLLIRRAQPVVKVALEEFRLDEIHDLLEKRLGDQVPPSLSARIHMKSGGLPGPAIAFLDAAKRHGRVRKQRDIWHDSTNLWTDEIDGAFEGLLLQYCEETREALEKLAMTGPLCVEQAAAIVGQKVLESLEVRGLIRLLKVADGTKVTLHPPGMSDHLSMQTETIRVIRLRQQVTDVLGETIPVRITEKAHASNQFDDIVAQREVALLTQAFRDKMEADVEQTWQAGLKSKTLETAIDAIELRLTGDFSQEEIDEILAHTDVSETSLEFQLYLRYLNARWVTLQDRPFHEVERVLRGDGDLGHPLVVEALIIGFQAERFAITPEALKCIGQIADCPGIEGEVGGSYTFLCTFSVEGQMPPLNASGYFRSMAGWHVSLIFLRILFCSRQGGPWKLSNGLHQSW